MKVLVAHNRYRSDAPSGENKVVDAEIDLLTHAGVTVVPFLEESDRIVGARGMAEAAIGPVYAPSGIRRFRALAERERPDVVHIHNVFPLISPWVVRVANELRIPVVQTVHNYRHSCVNGQHFRDGGNCHDCLGKILPTPAVSNGCYRGSQLQSVPMALSQVVHRQTWRRGVARYLCVSRYQAKVLVRAGLPEERLHVRPNYVTDRSCTLSQGRDVVFVGRLTEEKGLRVLLHAWQKLPERRGAKLVVVGDGPMRAELEVSAQRDVSISPRGLLDAAQVRDVMAEARVVVVPSLSAETFGLVAVEAFAAGRPVIASNRGALPELVPPEVGWVTQPTADELAAQIRQALESPLAPSMGLAARRRYEQNYSPDMLIQELRRHYQEVVNLG